MFSGSAASRASFSLNLDRPSSSRGKVDQSHAPGSSSRGSISKMQIPPTTGVGTREIIVNKRPDTNAAKNLASRGRKRYHGFDNKVAPYPLSYEPKIMGLDVLDHIYFLQTRKSVTWVDFKDRPPTRSLDLGCGTGAWVLDAAKEWKDCHFVGFDLVNIQPKAQLLPGTLADRIQWVHGNFLTGQLPFEDNFFDHVHATRIGWGIGEMQWYGLFEEIARVLCPGGAVEIAEEDILFPTLPRSYTIKGKQPRPSAPYPRPSLTLSPPPSPLDKAASASHAHALLESLFFGVFESRMINLHPTAIIPHHLNIHFRNVLSTSNLEFPFPPPPVSRQLRHVPSDWTARPSRRRSEGSESMNSFDGSPREQQQQTPPTTTYSLSSPSDSSGQESVPGSPPFPPAPPLIIAFNQPSHHNNVPLIPPKTMDTGASNLALQLNTAYQRILACKEAMWEELRRRLLLRRAGGEDLLHDLGWNDQAGSDAGDSSDSGHGHGDGPGCGEAQELERARVRFEELTVQFERDLRYRTALADALEITLNWKKPTPAPLSKHERARESELDKAIGEAARAEAKEAELVQCSRSLKAFVGFKEGKR